jgi:hypothetical protein
MKGQITILFLAGALHLSAFAVVSSTSVENIFATIPDGDLNGISSQLLTGLSGSIGDVNVTLSISGGFNGDYYAYLLHNGTSAILLNRTGRSALNGVGYSDRRPGSPLMIRQRTMCTFIELFRSRSTAAGSLRARGSQMDARLIPYQMDRFSIARHAQKR